MLMKSKWRLHAQGRVHDESQKYQMWSSYCSIIFHFITQDCWSIKSFCLCISLCRHIQRTPRNVQRKLLLFHTEDRFNAENSLCWTYLSQVKAQMHVRTEL